jgi:hypothetical protein
VNRYGARTLTASVRAWPSGGGDALGVDVDAGVVDDGVHPTDRVDLVGETVRLVGVCEIADYNPGCPVSESADADGP